MNIHLNALPQKNYEKQCDRILNRYCIHLNFNNCILQNDHPFLKRKTKCSGEHRCNLLHYSRQHNEHEHAGHPHPSPLAHLI